MGIQVCVCCLKQAFYDEIIRNKRCFFCADCFIKLQDYKVRRKEIIQRRGLENKDSERED